MRIAENLVAGESACIGGGGALLQNGSRLVTTPSAVGSDATLLVVSNVVRQGDGGGLALLSGSSIEVGLASSPSTIVLEENEALQGRGGGLFEHDNASRLGAGNTTIRRNAAREGGGAAVLSGAVEVSMLEAVENVAASHGGGLMLSGRMSRVTVADRLWLRRNSAGGNGGALVLHNGSTLSYGASTRLDWLLKPSR